MKKSLKIEALSEFLGTSLLLLAIVGSGFMVSKLTDDDAVQLLINAISTILTLFVIIKLFSEISGSHFNPVVTLLLRSRADFSNLKAVVYITAQILGAITGTVLANVMFSDSAIRLSNSNRINSQTFIGELIATFGLLFVITLRSFESHILVPAWIGAAYFFTASTAFANPAVTVGRVFTDSYSGISANSIAGFIAAQLVACLFFIFTRPLLVRIKNL